MEYIPILRDIDFEAFWTRMNEMDFVGQKRAERYYKVILTITLIISAIVSYTNQRMQHGVIGMGIGFFIALLVN
jgi:hypothetical protein